MREMKDSGIPWVGKIPKDWEVCPLKYLCSYNIETLPENTNGEYEFDYVDIGSVTYGKGIENYQHLKFSKAPSRARRLVKTGDVILSTVRTYLKATAQIPENVYPVVVSTGYLTLRANKQIIPDFLKYSVQQDAFISEIEAKSSGVSYPAINTSEAVRTNVIVPPVQEQHRIADFLDAKCARIDSIRKNVEAEIEALKQYKKSVITEAVTKGLDKNVEMKDSGADWVGKIPKDWIYVRLKMIAEISDGTHDTPAYVDKNENTYPLVTSKNIINGQIDFEKCHFIGAKDYEKIIKRSYYQKYDLIMPMIGSIGKPAIIKSNKEFATKNVAIIRFHGDENLSKFIYYQFYSNNLNNELKNIMSGSVQNFVSQNIIKNLLFCLPRKGTEIIKIVSYLDSKCSQIDSIVSQKQKQLEILNEYKKSLIYEYVTGKKEVPSV